LVIKVVQNERNKCCTCHIELCAKKWEAGKKTNSNLAELNRMISGVKRMCGIERKLKSFHLFKMEAKFFSSYFSCHADDEEQQNFLFSFVFP
jgi:hypothetical protein